MTDGPFAETREVLGEFYIIDVPSEQDAIDIAARPLETRWPAAYPARTLRSAFTDEWQDRDAELDADPKAQQEFRTKVAELDMDYVPIWAGEALDLIDDLELAAPLVQKIAHDAERALTRANAYIR